MTGNMEKPHPAQTFFSSAHPISEYLAITFLGVENHVLTAALDGPEAFVEDPSTRRLHSGLATLVLDTVMGGTVMGEMGRIQPIATAGLTTQHMRRPFAGENLRCSCRFEGIYHEMAHVSGQLIAANSGEILSTATGTFMIGTRAKPLGPRV
jgi:acyl-coenzyme A thioesterase PaaI-like protein